MKGNQVTALAPKIFDLLLVLAESGRRVLEKKSLLDKLWPDTFVEEGSLTRNISTLRKVLGRSPSDQEYITTVARRGYRFLAQVQAEVNSGMPRLSSGEAESVANEKPLNGKISGSNHNPVIHGRPSAFIWWGRNSSAPSLESRSIAVRPIRDISNDRLLDHFAEDLTEALAGELAQIRKLKVISAPVGMQEAGQGEPVSETTAIISLDLILAGSVIRIDQRVHFVVDTTDPQMQSQIWSHSYDRNLREVLNSQEEVACSIAAEIRADLTPEEQVQSSATRVKPEAFNCYLRRRFYSRRQNKDDNETAIEAFERAVAIDPTFAMAYAELAQS